MFSHQVCEVVGTIQLYIFLKDDNGIGNSNHTLNLISGVALLSKSTHKTWLSVYNSRFIKMMMYG